MTVAVRKLTDRNVLKHQAFSALDRGAWLQAMGSVAWDPCPWCTQPVLIERFSASGNILANITRGYAWRPGEPIPLWFDAAYACRACRGCLKLRAAQWTARATSEVKLAPRTWFCTFTLRRLRQYQALAMSASRLGKDPTPENEFRAKHAVHSKEMTLFLKRLRHSTKAKLRYIVVCEAHKSGEPHYHAFIHETPNGGPIHWQDIDDAKRANGRSWFGFTDFGLVKNEDGRYVCKYLAKSNLARVRASIDYGLGAVF